MAAPELETVVDAAGGIDTLADYLGLAPDVLETALSAPGSAWTERVRAMVSENTAKLLGMPSQGGFFWRITRRRVVKDWQLLARWSQATGDHQLSGYQQTPEPNLTEAEIKKIEASASVGDPAPPGYKWVNPDDLANVAAESGIEVDDPELLARAVQFCVNYNVMPEEMSLMYELGYFDREPEALPLTEGGLPVLPWEVIQRKLEKRYGIEPGDAWTPEAEAQFAADMKLAIAGTLTDSELKRAYGQMLDPQLIRTYVDIEDANLRRQCWRLMALASEDHVTGEELYTAFKFLADHAREIQNGP